MRNLFAQTPSDRELISHVVRRLGMGANPVLVDSSSSVADAISRSLQPAVAHDPPQMRMPVDWEEPYDGVTAPFTELLPWWIERMVASESPIQERLTWFWHDHFAMNHEKVDVAWVLWRHLSTIREHATGNFADLLKAVSSDAAMLVYLDGESNTAWDLNENFGREVLELYTLGIGNYTQEDVVAAARCFTGWSINYPVDEGRGFYDPDIGGWEPVLDPEAFDSGSKLLLGKQGSWSMDEALDVMLEHPATGRFVASKLYRELVGSEPDEATAARLGDDFAQTYEIMSLVEAIVAEPAFLASGAVNTKVRTPLEKMVSLFQAFEIDPELDKENIVWWMEEVGYFPFGAPNPAGYPRGQTLLGPATLAGSFILLHALKEPEDSTSVDSLFARFGVHDISKQSRDVVGRASDNGSATALAFASPEFALT